MTAWIVYNCAIKVSCFWVLYASVTGMGTDKSNTFYVPVYYQTICNWRRAHEVTLETALLLMMSCSTVQAQRSAGLHFQCNLRSHHREDNQAQVPCTDVTGDTIEPLCRIAQHKLLIVLFFFGLLLSFLFKFPRRHIFLLGNTHCTTLTPSTQ